MLGAMFGTALGWGFGALAGSIALWWAGTLRFLFPNVLVEPSDRCKVGFPRDYPPGHVETRFQGRFGIWLVHGEYGGRRQIYALRTVCTHLGCLTVWEPAQRRFKCPCHGSAFGADGTNLEGPAPRPLERYAIRLAEDGQLEVDKGRSFQEQLGQWTDPASFVEG
jgi:cytochrome b6-f complex iron-sulfur subunit